MASVGFVFQPVDHLLHLRVGDAAARPAAARRPVRPSTRNTGASKARAYASSCSTHRVRLSDALLVSMPASRSPTIAAMSAPAAPDTAQRDLVTDVATGNAVAQQLAHDGRADVEGVSLRGGHGERVPVE